MGSVKHALILLLVWLVESQNHIRRIAPYTVGLGDSFSAFCDAELAGAPDNIRGVYNLQMHWEGGTHDPVHMEYSANEKPKFKTDPILKYHWKLYTLGTRTKNTFQVIRKEEVQFKIEIPHAEETDEGEFCCFVVYISISGTPTETFNCDAVYISDKSVIVRPALAQASTPTTVTCDPDVAGIPELTLGLRRIWITWSSEDKLLNLSMRYILEATETERITLTKPEKKENWNYIAEGDEFLPNIKRYNRSSIRLKVEIQGSRVEDSGWFCCGFTFYTLRNRSINERECQHLTVYYKSIAPPAVREGESFTVACDARLANIFPNVFGMHRLQILWRDTQILFERCYSYGLDTKLYSLTEAFYEGDWQFTSQGIEPLNKYDKLDVTRFRLEIAIPNAGLADGGEFCCIGSYYSENLHSFLQRNNCISVTVLKQGQASNETSQVTIFRTMGGSDVLVADGLGIITLVLMLAKLFFI